MVILGRQYGVILAKKAQKLHSVLQKPSAIGNDFDDDDEHVADPDYAFSLGSRMKTEWPDSHPQWTQIHIFLHTSHQSILESFLHTHLAVELCPYSLCRQRDGVDVRISPSPLA
uniref:Uncharacterized protein n=1 Tax=Equus asinus asinus TaxID=83772 RepID=A0A8C4PME2_EQUAS